MPGINIKEDSLLMLGLLAFIININNKNIGMKNNMMIHRHLFDSIQLQNYKGEFKSLPTKKQLAKELQKPNTNPKTMNKMGRPRKNNHSSQSDTIENGYMQIQIMREKERRKLKPNTKNMYTYFPTYTTLIEKETEFDAFFNYTIGVTNKETKRSFSIPKEQMNIENKQLMERRRLVPLKKHSPIEKRLYRPQPNVTFLNVEKVSLIPISKDTNMEASMIPKTNFTKNISFSMKPSAVKEQQEDNSKILENLMMSKTKSLTEKTPTLSRVKPFSPPFERYHYYDFIWKIALSNQLRVQFPEYIQKKYKIYIGHGNNSMLIKTFFKRREYWWGFTQKIEQANFIWTQIKSNQIHNSQKQCEFKVPAEHKKVEGTFKKTQLYKRNAKILNSYELDIWSEYYQKNRENEQKLNPSFGRRNKFFKKREELSDLYKLKVHNHLPRNYVLGNKKALFSTMKKYYEAMHEDVFQYLPLTFHIEHGIEDPEYLKFLNYFYKKNKLSKQNENDKSKKIRNIWIVKPGEFSNRGNGITVCQTLDQIKSIVKNKKKHENGNWKTYIVQEYIDRPMLYYKRKFDIRHYMLITCINGYKKGYWYQDGYIRTTSYQYSTKNCFGSVHLTNDAIQKNLPDYGKYQKGNKVSYEEFQKYLARQYKGKYSFFQTIYPQMKKIAQDSMRASSLLIDQLSKGHNFQVFGFDFMIDADFHPWLIEINTNPCLEISCPALMDIIPPMIENTFKIAVDSIFLPPTSFVQKRPRFSSNSLEENKFQLLYDSAQEEQDLKKLFENAGQVRLNFKQLEKDEDELFDDDGVELDD